MSDDMRDALTAEVDVARADLERAVRRLDAINTMASLAAGIDIEHAPTLLGLERRLSLVDRARWRNAMQDAADTEAPTPQDPDVDHDAGEHHQPQEDEDQ